MVSLFCKLMPEHIGLNARNIVKSLSLNTKHQHSKIRKVTIEVASLQQALSDILTARHGGECFSEAEPALKQALNDKSADVRKVVYLLISNCLKRFSYPDLKANEARLVRYLLSGLSEPTADLREVVVEYLNQCGESRNNLEKEMEAGQQ